MFKILVITISFFAVQAQAKTSQNLSQRNIAKFACQKNQVAFKLDGKSHCLDIESPITDSEYQKLRYSGSVDREISNTEPNPDFF
jgi:hypothetical protein